MARNTPASFRSPSWLGSVDPARRQAFERAINVSNSGTVLLQTFINRTVQQLTLREFGLQSVLDRKPGQGDRAYINRRTPGTNGGEWVADTDALSEETGTYAQTSFAYRTLATRGKITRKLQATGRSYGDVLATEMMAKAEDFANALEVAAVTGDNGADANQINGLLTLVNNVGTDQVVSLTTASAGTALTLSDLDDAIDRVKGAASRSDLVIVGSFAAMRAVNAALQAQQQFNDMVEIAAGFRVRTYDGIPMVVSTAMPNTLQYAADGTISQFTGGSSSALAVINKRYLYWEELTPTTVMPLAKTDSQFDQFDMFWDGALVFSNTKGASLLCGLSV